MIRFADKSPPPLNGPIVEIVVLVSALLATLVADALLLKVIQSVLVKIPFVLAFALLNAFCLLLNVFQSVLVSMPVFVVLALVKLVQLALPLASDVRYFPLAAPDVITRLLVDVVPFTVNL